MADVSALSHDDMEGRLTGSPGAALAARYVSARFDAIAHRSPALVPWTGATEWRVPYELVVRGFDPEQTYLVGTGPTARLDVDLRPLPGSDEGIAEGPLVYIDSLAHGRWTVRDAIAVMKLEAPSLDDVLHVLPEAPDVLKGRAALAKEAGALGLLLVIDPRHPDPREDLRSDPEMTVGPRTAEDEIEPVDGFVSVQVSRSAVGRLLGPPDARGHWFSSRGRSPHVRLQVVRRPTRTSTFHNVAATVRGTEEPDEWVFVTAHYDHMGAFEGSLGDTLYNGADDNASGVAAVLALAEAFAARPASRSVAFVLFSGEEQGLLGSRAWVRDHGTEGVVFVVNLDMIGRNPGSPVLVRGDGFAEGLRTFVRDAARSVALDVELSGTTLIRNSDHIPFHDAVIPTLHLHTGVHDDYHQPSDEVHHIEPRHLGQLTRFAHALVEPVATRRYTPRYRMELLESPVD